MAFREIFGDAECEIIHFVNCEIWCWRIKWNEINPLTPAGISHAEGVFHARSVFHKSRKGFISMKKDRSELIGLFSGADSRTWTCTVLPPLEPESSASAYSTISAYGFASLIETAWLLYHRICWLSIIILKKYEVFWRFFSSFVFACFFPLNLLW